MSCDSPFHSEEQLRMYEDIYRETIYGDQPLEERKKAHENVKKWFSQREEHIESCKECSE